MHEYNAESPKQDSKRFNFQGRRNTFPIWLYNLSMYSMCVPLLDFCKLYLNRLPLVYVKYMTSFKACHQLNTKFIHKNKIIFTSILIKFNLTLNHFQRCVFYNKERLQCRLLNSVLHHNKLSAHMFVRILS